MSLFLFDVVLHFGLQALVAVDVSFLPCLPCLLMSSLFSTDGLPDEGVYPGVAVPCCYLHGPYGPLFWMPILLTLVVCITSVRDRLHC